MKQLASSGPTAAASAAGRAGRALLLEADPRAYFASLTLPELLRAFKSGTGESNLQSYWTHCQPSLRYDWPIPFETFRKIALRAADLVEQRESAPNEGRARLREALAGSIGELEAARVMSSLAQGKGPFQPSSGLIDEAGAFIPQPVRLDVTAQGALNMGREGVAAFINQAVFRSISNAYLAASSIALCSSASRDPESGRTLGELSKLYATTPPFYMLEDAVAEQLLRLHCRALRLRPRYSRSPEDVLRNKSREEAAGFVSNLLKEAAARETQGVWRRFLSGRQSAIPMWGESDLDSVFGPVVRRLEDWTPAAFADFLRRDCELLLKLGAERVEVISGKYEASPTIGCLYPAARLEHAVERISYFSQRYAEGRWASMRPGFDADRAWLSVVSPKDILPFIRLGDGASCCISSRRKEIEIAQGYEEFMACLLADEAALALQVHSRDRPLGFILGHLALNSRNELGFVSYVMYSAFSDPGAVDNAWGAAERVLSGLHARWMGQARRPDEMRQVVRGFSQFPPRDWKLSEESVTRLQTSPKVVMSRELEWLEPNKPGAGLLYVKRLRQD